MYFIQAIVRILSMLLFLFSVPGMAATATTTFQVSATVLASCTVSATNLAFGNYSGTAASTATSTITSTCTNTTPYKVGLSVGSGSGASINNRLMTITPSGTSTLNYNLYQDASLSVLWGPSDPDQASNTGSGSAQALTVYGQIPSGQFSVPGSYLDSIGVTVTY